MRRQCAGVSCYTMRNLLAILFLIIIGYGCTFSNDNSKDPEKEKITLTTSIPFFDTISTPGVELRVRKFFRAWDAFKAALSKKDTSLLKSLSTDCIYCSNCKLKDTEMKFSANDFYANHFSNVFDSLLISRINDNSKIKGHFDEGNWYIYSEPCIFKGSGLPNPRVGELSITIFDRTEDFEGGAAALAFIETAEGFKFCGYSTIP